MTRLVIADDHAFLRAGLEQMLGRKGHEIVASVGSGAEALAAIDALAPDLAILDLRMPEGDGLAVLADLRARDVAMPVLLLAAEIDDASLMRAMDLGVEGIVLKHADPAELHQAIAGIVAGSRHVDPELLQRAFALARQPAREAHPLDALSERDLRIARGVAAGMRNRDIGASLGISEGSVKINLHRIYDRLSIANRTELALLVQKIETAPLPVQ